MSTNQDIERLAGELGDQVYLDVAKWHLYLRDAKLHTQLADRLGPIAESGKVSEAEVIGVLNQTVIELGGGKQKLPLSELIPASGIRRVLDVLEEWSRSL
jgi:Protein of unknown function (DUF3181)